jgi:hypothetical protein
MKFVFAGLLMVFGFALLASPVLAHHGSAGYDMSKITVLKATVTWFEWSNPHCQFTFDATDDKGNVVHWTVEAPPPTILVERGWTRKSLKVGDVVTAHFHASKNGAPVGILQKVYFADGSVLFAYPDAQPAPAAAPTDSK